MVPNYIIYAIPVFFLLIGVELLVARYQKRQLYRLNDGVNDLGLGISEQVFSAFIGAFTAGAYIYIYDHFRLFSVPTAVVWPWIVGFLLKDFLYYWLHRKSHEINILWAGHAPHHQSEEYNLAVALRQGAFQGPFTCFFYWPMALLGFPPLIAFTVGQFNTLYQFWIHTRTIDRMGPLEWIFNTPSHHRVHHGKNAKYLDKNHAGVFIIWDKLFGTFQEEEEEPVYGTLEPLRSWNPLWGQVKYLVMLAKMGWSSPNRIDLFRIWFMPAGWAPEGVNLRNPADFEGLPDFRERYDVRIGGGLAWYAFVQFVLALGLAVAFLLVEHDLNLSGRLALGLAVMVSLASIGGVFESRRWAMWLELSRLALAPMVAFALSGAVAAGATLLVALGLGAWLLRYRAGFVRGVGSVEAGLEPVMSG